MNTPTAENVEVEENAAENAFYTAPEHTEEVDEAKRNSTDHTTLSSTMREKRRQEKLQL
jgi:hypothetical protein